MKPPGALVTLTGRLHIEYTFTGAAIAYLQPCEWTGPHRVVPSQGRRRGDRHQPGSGDIRL